jgi:hypothetical protein
VKTKNRPPGETSDRPNLDALLLDILRANASGMSEFALLKHLQAIDADAFPSGLFRDNLAMYQAHFLLFNALYRLRDRLLAQHSAILEIDVLSIRLDDYHTSSAGLTMHDPMRAFYLDWANLQNTGADDVERLLGGFWARYFAQEKRADALRTLGLRDPVDPPSITQAYRRLAMRHHPDRGGDGERFQSIQQAMEILRRC